MDDLDRTGMVCNGCRRSILNYDCDQCLRSDDES